MFQVDATGRTRGHSLKLVKLSKWNMLDDDSVMAKTVNGFKTKLEWERAKKLGLFLD